MKTATRLRILDIMTNPENNGKTQKEIAKLVGVTTRTLQNYLTDQLWQEIHKLRLDVVNRQISLVDKAVYAKAIQGDMTAARLIYGRWKEVTTTDQQETDQPEINEEELKEADDEIRRLRAEIRELEQQFPFATTNKVGAAPTQEKPAAK